MDHIINANLSLSRTLAKFCQIIASLLCWKSDLRTSSWVSSV